MKKVLFVTLLLLTFAWPTAAVRAGGQAGRPKLVVFLVADQMRADYPVRYASLLQHGLKRLTTQGAWYRNAAYPYLTTVTCVGHTTIGTGTLPWRHGMIANNWYDRESDKLPTCNADPSKSEITYAGAANPNSAGAGDSARWMMAPTLAETMRERLKSRVATMSIKARSAIGLAGHGGDFVTWFGESLTWETSTAFTRTPVGWFVNYLKGTPVTRDGDKVWQRLLPVDRYQYEDDAPGERGAAGWSAKFPHSLGPSNDRAFYSHWLQSPFADAYLGDMAIAAVDQMHLGTQNRTDFLGVSFSMLDAVGHAYGPRSHEVQDVIARLDETIGKLLDHLDRTVGAGNYVVAMSADHGVADMPDQITGGGRLPVATLQAAVEAAAKSGLGGDGPFVARISFNDIYFRPGVYQRLKQKPEALKSVIDHADALTGIARVFTSDEISTAEARASDDPQMRAAALSYYPGRSGDLTMILRENWLMSGGGTTHGTLYGYDQRVPVFLYGAGIAPGVHDEPVTPADIAPTVASIVGVTLPSADGKVLSAALKRN